MLSGCLNRTITFSLTWGGSLMAPLSAGSGGSPAAGRGRRAILVGGQGARRERGRGGH